MEPSYFKAYKDKSLEQKISTALMRLESCELCPRKCRVNRIENEKGVCQTGRHALVASFSPHFGEEASLVGRYGSGTIFFNGCNLMCSFCQNYDISHEINGEEIDASTLSDIMLSLQKQKVHNINFVSPSHVICQILEALPTAIEKGLNLPLVYNSGGYDCADTLKLLDGIFDIYMPDFKFSRDLPATFYCKTPDYPLIVKNALKEMHRQVGDLVFDENHRAAKGLIVRHLVMPEHVAGTKDAMNFLANEISKNTYVNIMDQYQPCGDISDFPEIARRITPEELQEALDEAKAEGLARLDNRKRDFLFQWR
jgi:putative pyruvate formate lyase activating enzyme